MTLLDAAPAAASPAMARMTLVQHLKELRYRLLVSAVALAVGVAACYAEWSPIYDLLRRPYCSTAIGRHGCNLYALGIFDQFQVRLRVAFIGGALVSAPVWLWQLGRFITPGLHRRERRYAAGFLGASLVLFAAGGAMAYLTLGRGLDLFLKVGGGHVLPLVSVQSYLSFVTLLLLAFGLAFEFPVVVVFLNVTGILSTSRMRRSRRAVYFGLFVLSAVLTPTTDPFTFLAMALPLCLLYEGCILLGRARDRGRGRRSRELDLLQEQLLADLAAFESGERG